jgi:hypothetical protein
MSTVVESCWHGKISSTEAEHRLMATNKAKAYLVRESDVRSNRLLLSYVSDKDRGLFKHLFVPTLSARKAYSSPNEAFSVMERMILTSEHCGDPIPPQVPDENRNNLSNMSADDGPASDLACHACDFVCEDKEKLRKYHQTHFVSCLYDQRIMNFQMDLKLILNYNCLVWFTFVLQPKLWQI